MMAGHCPGHQRFLALGYQARESASSPNESGYQRLSNNFFFVSVA
jgi:hypothetical protein